MLSGGAHANLRKIVYTVPAGILNDDHKLGVGEYEHIFVGSKAHWEVLGVDGAASFIAGSLGPPIVLDQQA
jgi:hypothetical protein